MKKGCTTPIHWVASTTKEKGSVGTVHRRRECETVLRNTTHKTARPVRILGRLFSSTMLHICRKLQTKGYIYFRELM